jgi:hypothetical protein
MVLLKRVQAYVGGVYRDQGFEVVSKWLVSLLRPHVEVAHGSLWDDYAPHPESLLGLLEDYPLPPNTRALQQFEAAMADYPSPFSSAAVSPSLLDDVSTRPAVADKPSGGRRRRLFSPRHKGGGDEGKQGTLFPRKGLLKR